MNKQKKAAISAFIISASLLSACGEAAEETPSAETTAAPAITDAKESEDSDETTADAFGGDYDPFADDYDPYGGNGAFTVTVTHTADETEALSAETAAPETAVSEENTHGGTVTQTQIQTEADNAPAASDGSSEDKKSDKKSDKKASSEIALELNTSNSWENGSDKFIQLDAVITNNSDSVVNGWTVTVKADSGVTVDQSWNCNIEQNGGTLTFTPVDYNKNIDPNQNTTFGLILKNAGNVDPAKATVAAGAFTAAATAGGGNNNNSNNNNNNNKNNNNGGAAARKNKDIPKPTTDDWLHTDGSKIYDSKGKEVWLTGINWFGYNTGTNTFDGLWTCDLDSSLEAIADRGFNLLRIPISAELINSWADGNYPTANFNQATNSYLVGMNSLEIFDYVVDMCRANGIKIMIDIHSAETDASGHMKNVWYTGKVSEEDFLDSLSWMAERYKKDDTIIAYDLKNEPHGKANENPRAKWDDSKDADNWKYIAEKAAKRVLDKNPNVLIMVEGIEIYPKDIKANGDFSSTNMGDYHCTWWGGNLRGVKDNPVDLGKYQNKLVYSPHDYGPTVYQQPWFSGDYTYESLYDDVWHDNWLYIKEDNIAPLLIGEWGGFMRDPNLKWMTYLRQLIKEHRLHHTFWCFNSNSGDTGGLVLDDFTTWDEDKYKFVQEVLWQQDGKFVGLDHEIPLGSNGITLSEAD